MAALETLHQRLQQCASEGRIPDYYAANHAIHEAFITLADKPLAGAGDWRFAQDFAAGRLQQLYAPGRLQQNLAEHLAVFAALKAGDSRGCRCHARYLLRQRDALRAMSTRNQQSRLR